MMLDELDALAAAARAADRAAARRRPRAKTPDKVKITYWSQAEHRLKTRWTTCMFKPSE